jgi:hypothetical protein
MKYLFFLILLPLNTFAEDINQVESKLIRCNESSVNFSIPSDQNMPEDQVQTICECLSSNLKPESKAIFNQLSQQMDIKSELDLVNFIEDNNRVQKLCAKKIFQ